MGISTLLAKEKEQNLPKSIDRYRYFTSGELARILGITRYAMRETFRYSEEFYKINHVFNGQQYLFEAKSVFEYLYPDVTDFDRKVLEARTRIFLSDNPSISYKRKRKK